jgi:small subunit ribosomal protein S8
MITDTLANVLSALNNSEKAGKDTIIVSPASKVVVTVMNILKKEGYVKEFKSTKDIRGGSVTIKLAKQINKVGVIKPRFSVTVSDLEKFEKRYLPAKDFGRILLSTSKGIKTHLEAKELKIGGVLLAYVY